MRKSLWMIPAVLLFTALGSGIARADTLIASGGYVTEIEGLNIDGTLYDVTFGATNDMEFPSTGNASDAAADIATALGTDGIVSSAVGPGEAQTYCVGFGPEVDGECYAYGAIPGSPWSPLSTLDDEVFQASVTPSDGTYWAEFSAEVCTTATGATEPCTVPTPEPATSGFMLIGIGLLGLVMRKRDSRGHQHAC